MTRSEYRKMVRNVARALTKEQLEVVFYELYEDAPGTTQEELDDLAKDFKEEYLRGA